MLGLVLAARDFHQEWSESEKKLTLPIILDAIGFASSATSALCYILPSARPLGQVATALKPIGALIAAGEQLCAVYKGSAGQEPITGMLLAADMADLGGGLRDAARMVGRRR